MRTFLTLGVFVLLVSGARADTLKTESDVRSFADGVMEKLVTSGLPAAFDAMKPITVVPDAEFESAALSSKAQREKVGARYGKTIGYEYIATVKAGDSLLRLTYLEKTEKHALPWFFYFYKTPQGWVLNSFVWNDQIQLAFGVP
jgi:hypothetical protein